MRNPPNRSKVRHAINFAPPSRRRPSGNVIDLDLKRGRARLDEASDDELVARVAQGDETACRLLMDRHLARMISLARRMLGNQADAEEIAQEVFLRVWTHASRWEPGRAQFRTWLHRVATNLCLDRLRRHTTDDIDSIPEPESEEPGPDVLLEQQDLAKRVDAALQTLPARQRAAVTLTHFQGLTNIEAAETLEISVEAVESLLGRARRQLRDALATERGEWLRKNSMKGA
ncbi:MAG: RNA polymerase sigma factor [Parvibaculum sp.]|uniref:RNA polymerase sigma factor n=1 Tax=Parvibaculum sp. TaxID=2024848 RepID=UPI0025CCA8C2|nr:RNA polymerase sigma factor [Parvibaculum sp.]MCE9650534.1 RNA polymerase sigma factor [Parvibaculum sp.]